MKSCLTRFLNRGKILLSVEEAAKLAGISPKTIYQWGYTGKLTRVIVDTYVKVDKAELERLIK